MTASPSYKLRSEMLPLLDPNSRLWTDHTESSRPSEENVEGVRSHPLKLRTADNDDKVQLNLLKDLAGIERGDEMPSTLSSCGFTGFPFLTRKPGTHLE